MISHNEVTAYGAAWKKGTAWSTPPNPIPADYITRAGYLWKNGERYDYDLSAGNPPLCWIKDLTRERSFDRIDYSVSEDVRAALSSSAVCDMPTVYYPETPFTVTIIVTPSNDVSSYVIEDNVPQGWTVFDINQSGSFDAVNNKVKYGPFFDNAARTLIYQITPPAEAKGNYDFTGIASFDGSSIEITGVRTIIRELADAPTSYKVLTAQSPQLTVNYGEYVKVFGSSGINTIDVKSGGRVECVNFIGANVVNIEDAGSGFTVRRSGAAVYLKNTATGTLIKIPAAKTAQTLNFADASFELIISNGKVMIRTQEVTLTEAEF